MGVTNFDAVAANSLTVNGTPVTGGGSLPSQTGNAGKVLTTDGTNPSWGNAPLALIGKGSTPATGWTSQGSGQYATKAVTVAGAAVGDLVTVTIDTNPVSGASPASVEVVWGRVTAADTLTLYYVQWLTGAFASNVTSNGAGTTISGAVLYAVQR